MFSKLHHPSQHQHQHQHQHHFSHHFQLSRDTSESDDTSRSTGGPTTSNPAQKPVEGLTAIGGSGSGDGASIEVVRRPRGRPPGSKNKPKPPVFITRDFEPPMSPYILEIPGGNDVVEAISRFCRRKSMGICVLTGSGAVANVTLRQPSTTPGATITFHGRFDILSISATFLPPQTAPCPPVPNMFAISLAGPQGQIVGGSVAGALIAAGTVYIIAASFNNPSYHRLPADDEARNTASGSGGEGQSPPVSSAGGGESGHVAAGGAGGESCGMSMYSCHLAPSDVIWAPTARPPPPPPPY
ncbi:AT-hook motif nuclear-localized protein 17 [Carica papaya]|uniref:AT-hook motif nuclear-localized protein 17 n=1 Tax=Carica papaya TaxID=3649 RepID=UPI000B8C752E|nr:AT-hook motif nuclear-localized protein 17 [Carica papaya]